MNARTRPPESDPHTREKLLKAAAKVFATKGYSGATVKAIASAAGCNVSLISYHFQGKEGLFHSLLESFGKERLRDAEKILTPPESLEDLRAKLRLWMQQFLLCHVHDNSVCTILHRENIAEDKVLWEIFQSTFFKAFGAIVKFLESAEKKRLLRKGVDPTATTVMIFGSLIHIARNQQIQKKLFNVSIADEKYRTQVVEQFLNTILHGISGSPA